MQHDSLALATELMLWSATSSIVDRGEYIVVATQEAPGWYGGNLLILPHPPAVGDFERWSGLFAAEFGHRPEIEHRMFYWPGDAASSEAMAPFRTAGFEAEEEMTLAASAVYAPSFANSELVIREIERPEEWEMVFGVQFACRPERFEPEGYARFLRRRIGNRRHMIGLGMGAWFGAFLGDRLAGTLGLFHRNGVGRFQDVITHPEFRRRGVCATLVHHVAGIGLGRWGCRQLAMVADPNYHAARIYERLGFRPVERTHTLCRYP
ncbi:MAG TPA: GNAT family N-acetyltransferase [Candidatus Kapabacteria bacterium]|nr:GNAT family N-acetyltransferase [Candidatus Kapabacteria bacterium]